MKHVNVPGAEIPKEVVAKVLADQIWQLHLTKADRYFIRLPIHGPYRTLEFENQEALDSFISWIKAGNTTYPEGIMTDSQNEPTVYTEIARRVVRDYYNAYIAGLAVSDTYQIVDLENVYVVFFTKTLQNWKATLGTTNEDGLYFEVTYNGDKDETYVDQYRKVQQLILKSDIPAQVLNFPAPFDRYSR